MSVRHGDRVNTCTVQVVYVARSYYACAAMGRATQAVVLVLAPTRWVPLLQYLLHRPERRNMGVDSSPAPQAWRPHDDVPKT
jgi:hypothetical protein